MQFTYRQTPKIAIMISNRIEVGKYLGRFSDEQNDLCCIGLRDQGEEWARWQPINFLLSCILKMRPLRILSL